MKPVNFSDLDIANIVEAVIQDDPDAIVIKDSLAKSLSQLREGRYAPVSEVSQVRQKTGLSQSQFAKSSGISVNTLKSWEQGQRKPSGSAQVLLKLLGKKPELIDEIAHLAQYLSHSSNYPSLSVIEIFSQGLFTYLLDTDLQTG